MLPSLVINLVLLRLWLVSNRWLLLEDWWYLPTLWLSVLQIWLLLITCYLHCEASFIKKPSHKWHSRGTIKKGHRISNLLLNKPHFLEGSYALHYPTNAITKPLVLHSFPTQLFDLDTEKYYDIVQADDRQKGSENFSITCKWLSFRL